MAIDIEPWIDDRVFIDIMKAGEKNPHHFAQFNERKSNSGSEMWQNIGTLDEPCYSDIRFHEKYSKDTIMIHGRFRI